MTRLHVSGGVGGMTIGTRSASDADTAANECFIEESPFF
jgi:hypothetical protein